ncbi:MAG: carbamate kinase, partial [Thermoplasmatales archaeon]
ELDQIRHLMSSSFIPIAVGGGGIPVVRNGNSYRGVEAVIDKDLASALLSIKLNVDVFIILTAVESAYVNFNKPGMKKIGEVSVEELKKLKAENHFHSGSMLPKIEAAIKFVEATGRKTIITNAENIEAAIRGKEGTIVVP